jgi:hypothetical protein
MFFFFLTQGHYSHQVSCTRLKSEPVSLLQNVNKVLWPFITNTRHVAQSLKLALWQYPCMWHTYCLGVFGQKFVIKLEYPLYLQDLALKSFGYSQNSHTFSETHKFRHMQRPSWWAFQNFSDVLNSGNTDSLCVLLCKVTTLKVTEAINV